MIAMSTIDLIPGTLSAVADAGEWEVDGRDNDCIVATALYFYDVQNVEGPGLSFRHHTEMIKHYYPQDFNDYGILVELLGLENSESFESPPTPWCFTEIDAPAHQVMGTIAIAEGRLITWPNTIQHRIRGLSLVDASRPGHCRYIKLSLVEPNLRLCSTRNVPPQQHDWRADFLRTSLKLPLPPEIQDEIIEMALAGDESVMSRDRAKEFKRARDEALAEIVRKEQVSPQNILIIWE